MTAPALAKDGYDGRTYTDTLPDCDLLRAGGWSGPIDKVPSVTTILKAAPKGDGLDLWTRRTVAEYTMEATNIWPGIQDHKYNPKQWARTVDKYATLAGWTGRKPGSVYARALDEYDAATADDWHQKLAVDLCANAPQRHMRAMGEEGDKLHKIAEDIAYGRKPVALLPEEHVYLRQVSDWFDRYQPEIICAEQSVFSRTHNYAGTPDLFAKVPGFGALCVDWKRKNAIYNDVAYQVAAYTHADYMITRGIVVKRVPVPHVDGAAAVMFPHDGGPAETVPLDLDGAFDEFLGIRDRWAHRDRNRVGKPVAPPAVIPGDPGKRAQLQARINLLRAFYSHTDVLLYVSSHWPDGIPTLKQSDNHTAHQLTVIEALLDRAEAEHQIPFDPPGEQATSNTNNNSNNMETAA